MAEPLPKYQDTHNEMVRHIGRTLDPADETYWNLFIHSSIEYYISKPEMSKCKSFVEVYKLLLDKAVDKYGDYRFLIKILKDIQLIALSREVEKYQSCIQQEMQNSMEGEQQCFGETQTMVPNKRKREEGRDQFAEAKSAFFRKFHDDTSFVWPACVQLKAVDSVCIILVGDTAIGTGFRVGAKYIMTANHVLSGVKEKSANIKSNDVKAKFGFVKEHDDAPAICFKFEGETFSDQELDCAIIELKRNPNQPFPHEIKLDQRSDDGAIVYTAIIGHPSGQKMKRDPNVLLLPAGPELEQKLNDLDQWSMNCPDSSYNKDRTTGYEKAWKQQNEKVLFNCWFTHGASGSPGITTLPNEREPVCVMMLLRGFPDFYFDLPADKKATITPDKLLEQGVRMGAIKDALERTNRVQLAGQLFYDV